jgi:hypothetical protein
MDNFVLGALLQQANGVKAVREDAYYRQHLPGRRVRPTHFLIGLAVAGIAFSVFGVSVI